MPLIIIIIIIIIIGLQRRVGKTYMLFKNLQCFLDVFYTVYSFLSMILLRLA